MDSNQPKIDTSEVGNETNPAQTVAEGKGKGKAPDIAPQDLSMGESDSSSDEETGVEDEVCSFNILMLSRSLTCWIRSPKKSVCSILLLHLSLRLTDIRPILYS